MRKKRWPNLIRLLVAFALVFGLLGVAVLPVSASPAITGITLDATEYRLGETVIVTVDADAAGTETIHVDSTYDATGFDISVTITEVSVGVFEGTATFKLAMETSAVVEELGVRRGDTVTVDDKIVTFSDTALVVVDLDIEKGWYHVGDSPVITIWDPLVNPLPTIREAVLIRLASDIELKTMYAEETEPHSGIFKLTIDLVDTTSGTGELQVEGVDTVIATVHLGGGAGVEDTDTAVVDDEAPISTITDIDPYLNADDFVEGITDLTLSATDITASGNGIEVLKVEMIIDGGSPVVVHYNAGGDLNTGTLTFHWAQPSDGEHTVLARATDLAGNVEQAPSDMTVEDGNLEIVTVDTVEPTISDAYGSRDAEATTEAVLSKVYKGADVSLIATVSDATSGIEITYGFVDATDTLTVTASGVVADCTDMVAGTQMLVPTGDLEDALIADLDGGGDKAPGSTMVVTEAGDWKVTIAAPTTVGTYTAEITATDVAGNECDEVDVVVTVVDDTTAPTFTDTSVTYAIGIQAVPDDVITITAKVTDNVAGVDSVVIEDASGITGEDSPDKVTMTQDTTYPDKWTADITVGALADITLGTVTLSIEAEDIAENDITSTLDVLVAELRTSYDLQFDEEEWVGVSIPMALSGSTLAETLVDEEGEPLPVEKVVVIKGGIPYVAIQTFDADTGEPTGVWTGDELTLEVGRGYLVYAREDCEVIVDVIGELDPMTPPPIIALEAGYNTIGFATVSWQPNVPVVTYLGSLKREFMGASWATLYTVDWEQARPTMFGEEVWATSGFPTDAGDAVVEIGHAYYLYMTQAGVLVP